MEAVDINVRNAILDLARYDCPTNITSGTNLTWCPYALLDLVHLCHHTELTEPSKSRLEGMMALLLMLTGSMKAGQFRGPFIEDEFEAVSYST